jgi:tetratricopeptide (TPR) repeat protein
MAIDRVPRLGGTGEVPREPAAVPPSEPAPPVEPRAMEPPRRLAEPQASAVHPSRQAFHETTSALGREVERLRAALAGPVAGRSAAAHAALALCRRYAIRRSRGARRLAVGLLDEVEAAGAEHASEARALSTLLTAEGALHELDPDASGRALTAIVGFLDRAEHEPPDSTTDLVPFAQALAVHALVQICVHFPEAVPMVGGDPDAILARAFALGEEAVGAAPAVPDTHTALGRVLLCSAAPESPRAAEDAFQRALAIDPDHDPALAGLAALALAESRPDDARRYADRLTRLGGALPQALHLRALAAAALGHLDEARRDLDRALAHAPNAGLLHLDAARLAARAGDPAASTHEAHARELLGPAFAAARAALGT